MKSTNKDAFYFPHDSNAKDDIKCVELICDMGLEGYGIYWVIIEILREQSDYTYPVKLIPALAMRFGTDADKFHKVIYDYGLFVVKEDKVFFSESLKRRMQLYENKKEQAREAARISAEKRAEKAAKLATVQQTISDRSTTAQPKRVDNIRVDKIKVDESKLVPPTQTEILKYIQANSYSVNSVRFYNYYSERNWKGIADWRAKVDEWNESDKLKNPPQEQPPQGVLLGTGERWENGRRTYGTGTATIPNAAPPRPGERYAWNAEAQNWIML